MGGRAVGKKHAIKTAALQRAGQVLPVGKVLQAIQLLVFGVGPAQQGVGAGCVDQHLHQMHLVRHGFVSWGFFELLEWVNQQGSKIANRRIGELAN